jgi:hypothetical protein
VIPPSRTLASGQSRSLSRARHRPGQEGVTTPALVVAIPLADPLAAAGRRRQSDNRRPRFEGLSY